MGIQPDPNAGEGIGSGGINEIGGAGGGPAPTADQRRVTSLFMTYNAQTS